MTNGTKPPVINNCGVCKVAVTINGRCINPKCQTNGGK